MSRLTLKVQAGYRRRRGQVASRALWRAAVSICRELVTETHQTFYPVGDFNILVRNINQ
jgi:hypothetical protein